MNGLLRTATVLFPGAAQHHQRVYARLRRAMALAEWCAADPGSFRARSVAYPGFREDMMWNDPGSAAHRSALHRVREKHQDLDPTGSGAGWGSRLPTNSE